MQNYGDWQTPVRLGEAIMAHKVNKALIVAGMAALTATSAMNAALAGGFDRGGVNIDQLFDTERYSFSSGLTFVRPDRKIKNVRRVNNSLPIYKSIKLDGSRDGQLIQLLQRDAWGVLRFWQRDFGTVMRTLARIK